MKSEYFISCETVNDVKRRYRELCKMHHPDKGGELATMQAINNEYAKVVRLVAAGADLNPEEFEAEILNAEQYKEAINAIISLYGIKIEICGGWIWVSGNTKPHKDVFSKNGFFWARKKQAWYFRSAIYRTRNIRPMSMSQIRRKYGSQNIQTEEKRAIA